MDAIAAAALEAHAVRNAQDLGLIGRGVHTNPNYYARLALQGHDVDPATGQPIPSRFRGRQSAEVLPPPPGPATITNPFTADDPEAAERQNRLAQSIPFTEVESAFGELLRSPPVSGDAAMERARQDLVGDLPTESQRAVGEALRPYVEYNDRQFARDLIAFKKAASEPGTFAADIDSYRQQLVRKYPEHAAMVENVQRPMSREQIQRLEDAADLAEHQDSLEQLGLPRSLYNRMEVDKQGNRKPVGDMSISEYYTAQRDQRAAVREDQKATVEARQADADMARLQKKDWESLNPPPAPINPLVGDPIVYPNWGSMSAEEKAAATQQRQREMDAYNDTLNQFNVRIAGTDQVTAAKAANPVQAPPPATERALAEGVRSFSFNSPEEFDRMMEAGSFQAGDIVTVNGVSRRIADDGVHTKPL